MKIKVTAKDIRVGEKWECDRCALTLAMRRAFRRRVSVAMDGFTRFRKFHRWPENIYELIRKFIDDFDMGRPVKPFTFELKLK